MRSTADSRRKLFSRSCVRPSPGLTVVRRLSASDGTPPMIFWSPPLKSRRARRVFTLLLPHSDLAPSACHGSRLWLRHYDGISSHPLDAALRKTAVIWGRWDEALGFLSSLAGGPRCPATLQRDWSVNVRPAIKWQSHTEELFYSPTCLLPNSSRSTLVQIRHFK